MNAPSTISRRNLLLGGLGGAGLLALAGCAPSRGGSSSGGKSITGNIKLANYPDWIGKTEISGFEKKHPGATVSQGTLPDGGWAQYLRQNKGAFDFALGGASTMYELQQSGLVTPIDASMVPNLKNVPSQYVKEAIGSMPLEQGKFGIVYNKNRVSDPPKSWAEFFQRAPEWAGRMVLPGYEGACFGPALLALGLNPDTIDASEYDKGRDLVVSVKKYIKTFTDSGVPKLMTDGSTDVLMAYDYDYATARADSDEIVWINPSDGTTGYLDTWILFSDSPHQDTVLAFMNYALEPKVYGEFINTTYASYILPSAEPYIETSIRNDPALAYSADLKIYTGDPKNATKQSELSSAAWQYLLNS